VVEVQNAPDGDPGAGVATRQAALQVEGNGINVIADAERHGTPRQLFWPWFAATVPQSTWPATSAM
jgi:hypothetical protein